MMLTMMARRRTTGGARFRWLAVVLLVCLISLPTAQAQADTPSGVDGLDEGRIGVLRNPDFEEEFSQRGAVEVTVADGWEPWWVDGAEAEQSRGYLRRPEYKPEERRAREGEGRVHSGSLGQKQFTSYATHTAGIYQRVPVIQGSTVSFSIWVHVWSSAEDDFDRSKGPGDYRVSVGIDPYGGTSGSGSEVVWSKPVQWYDGWLKLSVQAVARADKVTVFTRGQNEWRVRHNDSYWDDASLQVTLPMRQGTPTTTGPAPRATRTVAPTAPSPSPGRQDGPGLGGGSHLVFANEHLNLEWWRTLSSVRVKIAAPTEGVLALWSGGHLAARWAILVIPSDPLTVTWRGDGGPVGTIGVQVLDDDGRLLGECGLVGVDADVIAH